MSVAERHLSSELLSSYLDDEIANNQRPDVEGHLEDCPLCRHQLDGLRRVAATLQRLERAAPPPVLGAAVRRQIALDETPKGIAGRWQSTTLLLGGLSSHVGIMFALVFALAAILYLFAHGVEQRAQNQAILVPVLDSVDPVVGLEVHQTANRSFLRRGDEWWQQGVHSQPVRSLDPGSAEARQALGRDPGLAELVSESAGVVLILDGEVVRLIVSP